MSVTPPKPHDELMLAAARLSRAAPNMYAEFLKAFEVFTTQAKDSVVNAASDKVLLAQGRARSCVELLGHLTDATKQK